MAFLSSVRWRGVDINDGVNYLLDTRESALDNPNPTEATFAPRKDATPVLLGAVLRETTLTLNINIRAATAQELDARVLQLRQIFNPGELKEYLLERRLPHEQYYKTISASVRSVEINRAMRRCTVTLQTADMTWQDGTEQSQTILLFDAASTTEDIAVPYSGNLAVEPIIELTAETAGSSGPTPLYYRDLNLWYWTPARIQDYPIKLVSNWNVSALVSGGKMRSDYADISIQHMQRTLPHRIVERSSGVIDIWCIPTYANLVGDVVLSASTRGAGFNIQLPSSWGAGNKLQFAVRTNKFLPTTGTVRIDEEFISFNNGRYLNATTYEVTITARGVNSTTAADHYAWAPVLWPQNFRVNYGYAVGFERAFPNGAGRWPDIDYVNSDNREWTYAGGRTRLLYGADGTPLTSFNWYAAGQPSPRSGERLVMIPRTDPSHADNAGLVGTYPLSTNNTVQRLVLDHPGGQTQRRMSFLRLVLSLTGGPNTAAPAVTVVLKKVKRDFGRPTEQSEEMWRYTHNSTGTASVDTGYLYTDSWSDEPTHYVLEVLNAPPGTSARTLVRITNFFIRWDGYGGSPTYERLHWPHASALGSELGIGTGEFPVYVEVRNLSDADQTAPFVIEARMSENQTGIIDCNQHTVSGALSLVDVSYKKSNWLRLLPGTNTVRFSSVTGTGRVEVKLRWRRRY